MSDDKKTNNSGNVKWIKGDMMDKEQLLALKNDLDKMHEMLKTQHVEFKKLVSKMEKYDTSKDK